MIQMMALLLTVVFSGLISYSAEAKRITHYFTVVAPKINNRVCKMEGTMFVKGTLYYWHDGRCVRSRKQCRWGIGHRMNCLTPCQSVAADPRHYKRGQRVYIKQLAGQRCPSTGERMNGYFKVADVGAWIKGKRRFDLFTGICSKQSGGVCSRYTNSRSSARSSRLRHRFQSTLLQALERDKKGRVN